MAPWAEFEKLVHIDAPVKLGYLQDPRMSETSRRHTVVSVVYRVESPVLTIFTFFELRTLTHPLTLNTYTYAA